MIVEVKQSPKTNGDIYGGAVVSAPSVCEETGGPLKLGGPYWSGVLHDQWVVERWVGIVRRIPVKELLGSILTLTDY